MIPALSLLYSSHLTLSLPPCLPAGDARVARPHSVRAALWPSNLPARQWDGQPQVSAPQLCLWTALTLLSRDLRGGIFLHVVSFWALCFPTVRRWSVSWTQHTLSTMPSEYTSNPGSFIPEVFFSLQTNQNWFPFVFSAMFSQLMETAEPWFSSFEREVRKVSVNLNWRRCHYKNGPVWADRCNDWTDDMTLCLICWQKAI